jgi:hypothetical protein
MNILMMKSGKHYPDTIDASPDLIHYKSGPFYCFSCDIPLYTLFVMNIITIGLVVFVICIILVSMALVWHWKKFMPETGKGAGIFTVYGIGLAVLIVALFASINAL